MITPNGAPALAQAFIEDTKNPLGENVVINIDKVNANQIATGFTSNDYDFVIAPINVGVKMYNTNEKFKYAGTITFGNLYFASARSDFNLAVLKNENIKLFGKGTINEVIYNKLFEYYEINPNINEEDYLPSTADTLSHLILNPNDIALIAEPSLAALKAKSALKGIEIKTVSLQDMWSDMTNMGSYLQAGLFVRISYYEENKALANKYIELLKKSIKYCNDNNYEVSLLAEKYEYGMPEPSILENAIKNCNLDYKNALDTKDTLEYIFNLDRSLFGGKLPDEAFYLQ